MCVHWDYECVCACCTRQGCISMWEIYRCDLCLGEVEYERREQLRQKRAEIGRCWIKYCLNLLQDTRKLLEVIHTAV